MVNITIRHKCINKTLFETLLLLMTVPGQQSFWDSTSGGGAILYFLALFKHAMKFPSLPNGHFSLPSTPVKSTHLCSCICLAWYDPASSFVVFDCPVLLHLRLFGLLDYLSQFCLPCIPVCSLVLILFSALPCSIVSSVCELFIELNTSILLIFKDSYFGPSYILHFGPHLPDLTRRERMGS